ncbi:GNAT family N-acetyltransferase [Paenibacillus hodogayensis]|uniref:GNAT family N-acetyltransferase n=1 Tax=Paenibacillus hodogayensis TaxID=279208 RepID=A0ABV5VRC3_9BACL
MEWKQYDSARLLLDKAGDLLERDEAANSLLLGLLDTLARQENSGPLATAPLVASVDDDRGRPVLVLLLNAINLIVYGNGPEQAQAVRVAVSHLVRWNRHVPGLVGSVEVARQFAEEWAEAAGKTAVVKMNQRVHRLDAVNPVRISPGRLQLAGEDDAALIAGWVHEFAESVGERMTAEEAKTRTREAIAGSTLFLWTDAGKAVSMAKKTRPTRSGIALSLVYTPSELRGKGYATSCVAALSQRMLDEGRQFCCLYTDLSNPISNGIYAKIGYKPVQDSIQYRFN